MIPLREPVLLLSAPPLPPILLRDPVGLAARCRSSSSGVGVDPSRGTGIEDLRETGSPEEPLGEEGFGGRLLRFEGAEVIVEEGAGRGD